MTNYEQLKKKICEALPRLMDDVVGQTYERNGLYYKAVIQSADGLWMVDGIKNYSFYYFEELATRFQPLGIDPTLSDCLEYVKKSNYVNGVNMMTDIKWANHLIKIVENWNLSQPLLKHQSRELIDYLFGL